MAGLTLRKDVRDEGGMPGVPKLASLTSACIQVQFLTYPFKSPNAGEQRINICSQAGYIVHEAKPLQR